MDSHTIGINRPSRSASQLILLGCGIAGSLFFNCTYLILAALHPGFSSLKQTISDLELVHHGWMQSANFIIFGGFNFLFAAGLRNELKNGFGSAVIPGFQVMVGIGLVFCGIFIHDPFHTIATLVSFISGVILFFLFARRFYGLKKWKGWIAYSISSAVLMMIMLAQFGNAMHHGGDAGLFERLSVLIRSTWTILFVVRIFRGLSLS
ncbi:MAG TPA: DUF998 domain-containing protein [Chitinophagaceae bacterium]|nr:DUF998 domain-containing protein [Chitinophagaceae bacterium]